MAHLDSTMIVVLGHQHCGAVEAACSGEPAESPNIEEMVSSIKPSCSNVDRSKPDLYDLAVRDHVHTVAERLVEQRDPETRGGRRSLRSSKPITPSIPEDVTKPSLNARLKAFALSLRAGVAAAVDGHAAVDDHRVDPHRILLRLLERANVGDRFRIENDEIGEEAFLDRAAIGELRDRDAARLAVSSRIASGNWSTCWSRRRST